VPNFSVLDGWWIEGHIEGVTGWAIGPEATEISVGEGNDEEEQRPVLIVDGEKLSGLIAKMIGTDYSTDVAHDGLGAVQKLRGLLPEAIIVEVDIPGNGIKLTELLGVNPKYSGVPIILTSANPSPDMIVRAKNAGADSFLAKPFKPSDLKGRLTSLATVRSPSSSETGEAGDGEAKEAPKPGEEEDETGLSVDIANRVKSIEGLPSFPATHAEILKLANSDDSSSDDIAEKLQLDSGLLATVFKIVNSAGYGFRKKVDSLQLAVTLLGLEELANIVMAARSTTSWVTTTTVQGWTARRSGATPSGLDSLPARIRRSFSRKPNRRSLPAYCTTSERSCSAATSGTFTRKSSTSWEMARRPSTQPSRT
tara:strand:- start:3706 stop:4806 length:1101 start_codon:yes stop_codon:yes gene_type:complete